MSKKLYVNEDLVGKPSTMTPTLFVGLGGCGSKVAVRIADQLRQRPDWEDKLEPLVKVACVDTNINDLEKFRERCNDTFLISDFEKAAYAKLAQGRTFLEADTYFTQWVPDSYKFRSGDTAGAGQIRIESRLGLYYQMKHTDFVARFRKLLEELRDHELGHRRIDSSEIRIVISYSVAGGTGSGAHLAMAYMLYDLAKAIGKPMIIGVAVLPSVFEDKAGLNKDGICANGYAALKETEYLMGLGSPESSFYPDEGIPFHYDASDDTKRRVYHKPFDFLYVIDKPEKFSVDNVVAAAADGLYLQLYSDIFKEQAGDYDNYTQHQRFLVPHDFEAKGMKGFTSFYGSYGAAVLLAPAEGLLTYCSQAAALEVLQNSFVKNIPPDDVFARLREDPTEFNKVTKSDAKNAPSYSVEDMVDVKDKDLLSTLQDRLFMKRIRELANAEWGPSSNGTGGTFTEIYRHGGMGDWLLPVDAKTKLAESYETTLKDYKKPDPEKSLGNFVIPALVDLKGDRTEHGSPDPDKTYAPGALLRVAQKEAEKAFEQAKVVPGKKKIAPADLFNQVSKHLHPALKKGKDVLENGKEGQLPGFGFMRGDADKPNIEGMLKATKKADLILGRFVVLRLIEEIDALMTATEKGKDKEIKAPALADFAELAADKAGLMKGVDPGEQEQHLPTLVDAHKKYVRSVIEKEFVEKLPALKKHLKAYADQIRKMDAAIEKLSGNVGRSLSRLIREGDEYANRFVLDGEALQMENGRRLWDFYYIDQVVTGGNDLEKSDEVVSIMTRGVLSENDDAAVALRRIYDQLVSVVKLALKPGLLGNNLAADKDKRDGLTIDKALELEVEYRAIYTSNAEQVNRDGLRAVRSLVGGYRARPERKIDLQADLHQDYLRDKIKRLVKERADYLCRYDESRDQQGGVRPDKVYLCAIREDFAGKDGLLQPAIERANRNFSLVTNNWHSPREIVFYQAVLNVPLYVFGRMDELRDHYHRFRNMAKRAKVLHIDKNWETTLQDLDPVSAANANRKEKLRANIIQFAALLTLGNTGPVTTVDASNKGDLSIHPGGFIARRNGVYQIRDPKVENPTSDTDWTVLGESISDAVENLPKTLAAEPIKYMQYQRMLNVIQSGASPMVVDIIANLPFKWRSSLDKLRQAYGTSPTELQKVKLEDYAVAYERLTEALSAMRDRLNDQHIEQQTLGVDAGQDTFGLTAEEFGPKRETTIACLNAFASDWEALLNPSGDANAMQSMNWLFTPKESAEGSRK